MTIAEWLQGQFDQYGYPRGIVAYADLIDLRLEETLYQHRDWAHVRDIRIPLNYDKETLAADDRSR